MNGSLVVYADEDWQKEFTIFRGKLRPEIEREWFPSMRKHSGPLGVTLEIPLVYIVLIVVPAALWSRRKRIQAIQGAIDVEAAMTKNA